MQPCNPAVSWQEGDTTTLSKTLAKAEANLEAVNAAPTSEDPAECVADKGYHSRAVLRALNDSPWKTRIAAPKQTGFPPEPASPTFDNSSVHFTASRTVSQQGPGE